MAALSVDAAFSLKELRLQAGLGEGSSRVLVYRFVFGECLHPLSPLLGAFISSLDLREERHHLFSFFMPHPFSSGKRL